MLISVYAAMILLMYFLAGINKAKNFSGTVEGLKKCFFKKSSYHVLSGSNFRRHCVRNCSPNDYNVFVTNKYAQ